MDRTINFELARLRQIAHELAERGPTRQVCEDTASILTGPLPRLFNGLNCSSSPALMEPAYEAMRLCVRINRRCRLSHPETPDEPFDAKWFAGRLEILSLQIGDQLAADNPA